MRVLIFNCGSSSLKFQVVETDPAARGSARSHRRPRGGVEGIGGTATSTFVDTRGHELRHQHVVRSHLDAAHIALSHLGSDTAALPLDAVGHRVVHGGARFTAATRLDDDVVAAIDALSELAPLHNPAAVSVIRAARDSLAAVPQVAVFDTAFHHSLPDYAAHYALPASVAQHHRIRRYGFHGIAHQYLAMRYAEIVGASSLSDLVTPSDQRERPIEKTPAAGPNSLSDLAAPSDQRERSIGKTPAAGPRLITLQLGNGCSAAAICQGRSVDTSMGFTPLEGLMMGTRSGDIDPSVVGYLMRREGLSAEQVDECLNQRSGLLGVSGRSNDMRDLLAAMAEDPAARLAVEMFCYRVSKYVGAYLTVLGGTDAIIFSGGIGEHSPPIRARVCARLRWCGVHLDPQCNTETVGSEARISAEDSTPVYVIPADEELLIARETAACLEHAA